MEEHLKDQYAVNAAQTKLLIEHSFHVMPMKINVIQITV